MKRIGIQVLVATGLAVSAPAQAATYEQVVAQFRAVAFSDEEGNYSDHLRRAKGPVNIRVEGPIRGPLRDTVAELRRLTGIDIAVREPANVFLTYVPRGCSLTVRSGRAEVRISTGSRLATTHCLYEELAQLLGPADDACHYRPSIFCDPDFPEGYTEADKIILRATFDPRLRVGMTRAEGMPIARTIIRELYEERFGPIREDAAPNHPDPDALSLP